jgi:predicted dehydrogenase
MGKVKIALVGVGGISQVVRIPSLKKNEDVELVALCDVDESKVSLIAQKYRVPKVYFDIQNLIAKEELDGVLICTPNNLHYSMALAALDAGINTLVEKPIALSENQVTKMVQKAKDKKVHLVCGMHNRFRKDAVILREFIDKTEIGDPFYIKAGWLRKWEKSLQKGWNADAKISGGGVVMDLGLQLIDLALWLLNNPKVKNIRSNFYSLNKEYNVEDSALIVLQTEANVVITIETSWRMHLENDLLYTHVFGSQGGAFLNPLRINKELHGNLVNVTPIQSNKNIDMFTSAFESEINNFVNVIQDKEAAVTPGEDGIYLMNIIDSIYKSAELGQQVDL